MTQFRQSAEELTVQAQSTRDKTGTAAWHTLAQSGSLAGEVARATTTEVEALRREFRHFLIAG